MLTVLLALCLSCSSHADSTSKDDIEKYSTEGCLTGAVNDVFSNVELIELQFKGDYYPKTIGRMFIDSEILFICDAQENVYLYSLAGEPISCSLSARGEGPGEHPCVMGFSWNPTSSLIEILTPQKLMFYDKNFKFMRSCDLKTRKKTRNKKACMYQSVYDISSDIHLLVPTAQSDHPFRYVAYNSKDKEFFGEISYEEDVWSFINMQSNNFFKMPDGQILCHPYGLLPYTYELDPETLTLNKTIILETSGEEITHDYIESLTGNEAQKAASLLKCNKSIPVNTIMTSGKMLVTFKKGNSIQGFYTVIFQRGTDESSRYNLYDGEERVFPLIMFATDDYAYSIVEKAFIETNPTLLLNNENKIKELSTFDDESWVVLKYKFKR